MVTCDIALLIWVDITTPIPVVGVFLVAHQRGRLDILAPHVGEGLGFQGLGILGVQKWLVLEEF